MSKTFSLDELCTLTDLPKRTVRYYMQMGLVDRPIGETSAAHYLAGHLDRTNVEDLVGSVAGDDTVIVVMRSIEAASDLCDRLLLIAGGGQMPTHSHGTMTKGLREGVAERRTS